MFTKSITLGAVLLTACVADQGVSTTTQLESDHDYPANVPAALAPAADQRLAFSFDASGVQIYQCRATATGAAWTFVAPDARLYRNGHDVGHHYAGPTWEYQDGSLIAGAKLAAATVDLTAIPWLLLKVASHGGPEGKMSEISSIQRLETVGGLAPATGCDLDHVGANANVPYTATYFFFRTETPEAEDID
ncbi:MAG: hypothetical protein JWO36_7320 [Myxococcales bacterium]|nr:hypothetical protein [Myxococcales bacterium]